MTAPPIGTAASPALRWLAALGAILVAVLLLAGSGRAAQDPQDDESTYSPQERLQRRIAAWFEARVQLEAQRGPAAREDQRDAERLAHAALVRMWEQQGGDRLLADVAPLELQGLFAQAMRPKREPAWWQLASDAFLGRAARARYRVRLPVTYDPERAHRSVVYLVRNETAEDWPAHALHELERAWGGSERETDTVFVLPEIPAALGIEEPIHLARDGDGERERQLHAAVMGPLLGKAYADYHLDLDRVVLDCGPGTGAFGLQLATHFPSRFAAVILREPVLVPGLRLESLTGLPFALFATSQSRKACESLNQVLNQMQDGACEVFEALPEGQVQETYRERFETWVRKQVRDLMRSRVVLAPNRDAWQKGYWVAILDAAPLGERGESPPLVEVEAERGPNRIVVRTQGVREISLLLNDTLVDLDLPLRVTINGTTIVERRQRSFSFLGEQMVKLRDPTSWFTTSLTLRVPARR